MDQWKGDDAEKQRRIAEWKGHSYKFSSYDPDVTRLYSERFPWIGARNLVVVCTKRTAMTLELAVLLEILMTTGKFSVYAIAKAPTQYLVGFSAVAIGTLTSLPLLFGDSAFSCSDQLRRRPSRTLPRE